MSEWTLADETEQLRRYQLLTMEGLSRGVMEALLKSFASATAVFEASENSIRDCGKIKSAVVRSILDRHGEKEAESAIARMKKSRIRILAPGDANFPESLIEIPMSPPLLMMRGEYDPLDQAAVAVVGSRHCSHYGQRMANKLAMELAARGYTIVSGLARGIDAAAHRGALAAGGRTIAVLASGLENLYPPEHADLAGEILQQGAIMSEAPLDGAPIGKLFPKRNRIISGLSLGVVVVEAANRSGTLSTANHALEQNRQVFAVPGRVGDLTSEGTNRLIRDGANPVTCVDDILECLGPRTELTSRVSCAKSESKIDRPAPVFQNDSEAEIYKHLTNDPLDLDCLIEQCGLASHQLTALLVMMELRRLVKRYPGNRYARA